jgi:hypothetical protein
LVFPVFQGYVPIIPFLFAQEQLPFPALQQNSLSSLTSLIYSVAIYVSFFYYSFI